MNSFLLPSPAVLATRILDSKNATEPMIEMTSFKPAFSDERQGTSLLHCAPEEEGIPSDLIREFLEKLHADSTLNTHNVVIARNGRVICETSFGAQDIRVWKHTFSACKSIVSLAIGMLIDDGLCSLDEKIVDLFSKEVGVLPKHKLKNLCIKDLLTMRSSLQFAELDSMTTTDWVKGFLNSAVKGEIGTDFKYNSLNTYLLSAIVVKKTGKSLTEFLDERLFSPLGIVNYYWEKSPQEIEKGGWGLYLLPHDLVKIGYMVLSDGVYNGKRILSSNYLKEATAKQAEVIKESDLFHYGYQIWVGKNTDTFLFNGMLGQNLVGFRRNGLVVFVNSGNGEFFHTGNYFRRLFETFDRDFEDKLPHNIKAEKRLRNTITSLSLYTPKKKSWREYFVRKHDFFQDIVGAYTHIKGDKDSVGLMPLILQGVQNLYTKGFVSISFEKKDGIKYLVYHEKTIVYEIPLGFDAPIQKHYSFGENDFLVASSARFKYNEDDQLVLIVCLDFLETPCSRILKFVFGRDGQVRLLQSELPGEEFVSEVVSDALKQIAEKPLLAGVIDRFGEDYVELKLKKALSPNLLLKKTDM